MTRSPSLNREQEPAQFLFLASRWKENCRLYKKIGTLDTLLERILILSIFELVRKQPHSHNVGTYISLTLANGV